MFFNSVKNLVWPNVYGGAGVHVAELTRALRELEGVEVQVRAFGWDERRVALPTKVFALLSTVRSVASFSFLP